MDLVCNELCTDDYKYFLDYFNFGISGYVNGTYNEDAVFIYTQENPLTGNIIYDYILNENGDTLYANNQ